MMLRMLFGAQWDLEIKIIVVATPGIKLCPASRAARATLHVFENG
jgi:hypothetical protein